jgi:Kae1-associated kinase Bud32
MTIIAQGAEAVIRKVGDTIVKERIAKTYRISQIDGTMRKSRTRREAKVLTKLEEAGLPAPHLISMDDRAMTIVMEFLEGPKLRDVFDTTPQAFSKEIGQILAALHNLNIIHADLTTSNMMVCNKRIHLIDFGLSYFSHKIEDKAVDLHLLGRALESKHHKSFPQSWQIVIEEYEKQATDAKKITQRLETVERRGRNKGKPRKKEV